MNANSFPGHAGRPGQVGGSVAKGYSIAKGISDKQKKIIHAAMSEIKERGLFLENHEIIFQSGTGKENAGEYHQKGVLEDKKANKRIEYPAQIHLSSTATKQGKELIMHEYGHHVDSVMVDKRNEAWSDTAFVKFTGKIDKATEWHTGYREVFADLFVRHVINGNSKALTVGGVPADKKNEFHDWIDSLVKNFVNKENATKTKLNINSKGDKDMQEVQMDFYGQGQAVGEVAAYAAAQGGRLDPGQMRPYVGKDGKCYITIYSGGDPKDPKSYKAIQTNAGTLRRDEWKRLDEVVLGVSRYRLGGIADLVSNGLTYDLGNGMETTVLEYHDSSDAMEATLTMDGVTRSNGDRPVFTYHYLPLPIVHVDYEINARVLAVSRRMGNPLDTMSAELAARKVNEKLESMLFTNTTYAFGGGTIYSYINHPDINLVTLSLAWDDATKTGANIITDVLNCKQASIDAYHYGPWMLYIPTAYETKLDADYDTTTPGTTIRERILKIDGIKGIKVIDTLTANTVLCVQMTPDVVRLVRGMPIQNVEWQTEGKFITKYKVMTIQVPQIRSDQNGASGITKLA